MSSRIVTTVELEKSHTCIEVVDLLNFFRAEFESKTVEILCQSVQVDSLGERDGLPLDRPVDADLSRGSAMLLSDFSNGRVSQNVQVLLLSFADRIVGGWSCDR